MPPPDDLNMTDVQLAKTVRRMWTALEGIKVVARNEIDERNCAWSERIIKIVDAALTRD